MTKFIIIWDNDHACGALPGSYDTEEEAIEYAEEWLKGMIDLDDNPSEAAEIYSYEIKEINEEELPNDG